MSARWYSEDPRSGEQVDYSAADAKKLEESYQGRKQPVNLTIAGMKFTIDIKNMTQSNNSGGSRPVKRVQVASASSLGKADKLPVAADVTAFWKKVAGGADELTADQFGSLFGPLGVNAENADCFVFVYLLKCAGCWKITQDDFEQGCTRSGMKPDQKSVGAAITAAKKTYASNAQEFLTFYAWVFNFCRNSPTATIIPTEEAVPIIGIIFTVGPKASYPLEDFCDFLNSKVKAISSDLWKQTGKFVLETKKDLSNFDEMHCWNTAIDDFVDAKRQ